MSKHRSKRKESPGRKRSRSRTDGSPRLIEPGGPGNRTSQFWAIGWSERGRSRVVSTGETCEEAAEIALQEFCNKQANPAPAETVNVVLDHHMKELRETHEKKGRRPRLLKDRASALRVIRTHMGHLAPAAITPAYLRRYSQKRRASGVSDRTISIELAYFKAALNKAMEDGLITKAPTIKIPEPKSKARTRVLKKSELIRVRNALREAPLHLRGFVLISIYTGQRGIHIRSLKWEHVDFSEGWIYFTESNPQAAENKQCADAPIPRPLLPHLVQMKFAARTPWVIEWKDKPCQSMKRSFSTLCRRAGLDDLHIHDLRRSFATIAAQSGADLNDVADFMNLDRETLRRHYAHGTPTTFIDHIKDFTDEG